jgi:hypothetical protein
MEHPFQMAYGLDMADGQWILAQCARRGVAQVRLAAPAESEEMRRALQAVQADVEQGRAALAVSAPAAQTVVRRLRAPFPSLAKAARIWPSLLDVDLPFPVESAVTGFVQPRVVQGQATTLAAAIRRSDWSAFEEQCNAVGVQPTHADVEALALWEQQSVDAPSARADASRLLIWLGADHVTIVRGRGGDLLGAHVLRATPQPSGSGDFVTLWAARLQPIVAAQATETDGAPMDVWWAGPGTEDAEWVARLRAAMPAVGQMRHETHSLAASLLARALARRAAGNGGINFKSGADTHPALHRAAQRRRQRAYLGVVIAALVVLALNFGERHLRQRQLSAAQQNLSHLAESITGAPVVRGQELLFVERALAQRDEDTRAFREAMEEDGLEERVARVVQAADELHVEIVRLNISPVALTLQGSAPGIQVLETFAEKLRGYGWQVQADTSGLALGGRPQFVLKGMHDQVR